MSRLHITDSPEWTRFFWAVMLICIAVILSSLFSCESDNDLKARQERVHELFCSQCANKHHSSIEIEIIPEPGEKTILEKRANWLLSYWYYAAIAVMLWAFYMAIRPKTHTHDEH